MADADADADADTNTSISNTTAAVFTADDAQALADANEAAAAEAAVADSIVAHALNPPQPPEEAFPAAAAAEAAAIHYDAPVLHAVHDPHAGGDAAAAAQAAQAIAASASAYGIPTTAGAAGIGADGSYAAVHRNTAGMDYAALAASGASVEGATVEGAVADGGADVARAREQARARARTRAHQAQLAQAKTKASSWAEKEEEAERTAIREAAFFEQCLDGRRTMDLVLDEQRRALSDLALAEAEFDRAKERLDRARERRAAVDARLRENAEFLAEELVREKTRWNSMYRRLAAYRAEHGHCHVLRNPLRNKRSAAALRKKGEEKASELSSLGTWVGQVRLDARRPVGHPDRLEPYKIVALDRLGFDWEPRENYWTDMFEQLKVYLEKNGGRMPPRFINNKKFSLGQWCDTQLDNYRKFNAGKKGAYITQEKIDMLNEIGFVWDKRGHMWRENYDRLKEFKQRHGHCNATASNNGGDKSFGTWVTKQKRKYSNWKRGETKSQELSLTDEQAALMDDIGFAESVFVDGRKLRHLGKSGKPKKAPKQSFTELVDSSEKVQTEPECQLEKPPQQQAEPQRIGGVDEKAFAENYDANNMDPSAVANSWGDSANAVSLLVDAIMNKESQPLSSDAAEGSENRESNEWATV